MCIRWGGTYSTSFNVTNGVRQGSILSPYLFNSHSDDLSVNHSILFKSTFPQEGAALCSYTVGLRDEVLCL